MINRDNHFFRISGLEFLDDTIGESCAICAEAVSTCINRRARGDAYIHTLETIYFTVIFIIRSIHELASFVRSSGNRQILIVLRTIACWIDAVVYRCLTDFSDLLWKFDMNQLNARIAFYGLVVYVPMIDFHDVSINPAT